MASFHLHGLQLLIGVVLLSAPSSRCCMCLRITDFSVTYAAKKSALSTSRLIELVNSMKIPSTVPALKRQRLVAAAKAARKALLEMIEATKVCLCVCVCMCVCFFLGFFWESDRVCEFI